MTEPRITEEPGVIHVDITPDTSRLTAAIERVAARLRFAGRTGLHPDVVIGPTAGDNPSPADLDAAADAICGGYTQRFVLGADTEPTDTHGAAAMNHPWARSIHALQDKLRLDRAMERAHTDMCVEVLGYTRDDLVINDEAPADTTPCVHCDHPRHTHGRRYAAIPGWHPWTAERQPYPGPQPLWLPPVVGSQRQETP